MNSKQSDVIDNSRKDGSPEKNNLSSPIKKILHWPEAKVKKGVRKQAGKEKAHFAITSNEWRKMFKDEQMAKEKLEKDKLERNRIREEKKKQKEEEKENKRKEMADRKTKPRKNCKKCLQECVDGDVNKPSVSTRSQKDNTKPSSAKKPKTDSNSKKLKRKKRNEPEISESESDSDSDVPSLQD